MAWLSRVNFVSSDTLSFTDVNNLGNDIRAWGDNVNGGGYTLSNVVLSASSGTMATVTGGTGTTSTLALRSTSGVGTTGADIIFQTGSNGATEAMRIQNGGNVGIGTASPGGKLTIVSGDSATASNQVIISGGRSVSSGAGAILFTNSFWNSGFGAANIVGLDSGASGGHLSFGTLVDGGGASGTPTEKMRILQNGNVGIGTTSPQGKLAIGNYTIINALDGGSASSDIGNNLRFDGANWRYLNTGAASLLQFTAGDTKVFTAPSGTGGNIATLTERMQITSSGNVGIGTTPSYRLQLSTDSAAKPSTNTWTIASDARLKTVLGDYEKGLDAICALRPVRYQYNGLGGMVADGKEHISIVAQEAQDVFPECIGTFQGKLREDDEEEAELLNYNGHAVTFALINAVRELKDRLDALA